MRAKYSALLKTAEGKEEESEEAGAEEGDADITFIPGLKDSLSKALKEKEATVATLEKKATEEATASASAESALQKEVAALKEEKDTNFLLCSDFFDLGNKYAMGMK